MSVVYFCFYFFWNVTQEIIAQTNGIEFFPLCFLLVTSHFQALHLSLYPFISLCTWWEIKVHFHFYHSIYPVSKGPSTEKISVLGSLCYFWKNQSTVNTQGYFMGILTSSIGQCVCFYSSTMLFSFQWLYHLF